MKRKNKPTSPPRNIPRATLQPADVGPLPSAEYRKIPMVQKELLTQFEDIELNEIVLVEEGNAVGSDLEAGRSSG